MPGTYGGQEEGVQSPRIGVTDGCELPCGFWELGHLQEQPVILTAEPSFQPQWWGFDKRLLMLSPSRDILECVQRGRAR